MANERLQPGPAPFLSLRMVEWSLVAALIVVLALVFMHKVRVLQGQAELSAIKTTLGALRTALVLDHLHHSVTPGGASVALLQRNPFELLQRRPANYRGELSREQADAAPDGSWVFDPVCVCVGYRPLYAEWLDSPGGEPLAWYQLSGEAGPWQLTAKEAYVWQGQVMN
ncbi:MAG: hypothetical protein GZ093_11840 [Rhodoferax sp.]|uniref:hypothetical protein n=1 Tax=Rhodoferax sp. TaxID=50421 RepID=UPI001401B98A|nr:hypothetical protein [Rhodoferax sp.]NDP39422.1 hypothetical protein [Rhodoferax sp.]